MLMYLMDDQESDNSTYEEKRHMNSLLAEEIKRQDEIISKHISEKDKQSVTDYYNIDRLIEDIQRSNQLQQAEYERKQAMLENKEKSIAEKLEEMVELSDGVFYDMDTAYVVMKYNTYKDLRDSKDKLGVRIDNDAAVSLIIDTYVHIVEAIKTVAFVIFLASFFLDWSRTILLISVAIYLIGAFLPTDPERLYDVFLKSDIRKRSSE